MAASMLQNRYRIDEQIGQGGMGVVYRGYDLILNRTVAIKLLSNANLGTTGRARLLSEAQAAARLNHPNIVTVFDAGETDQVPYIVMELVPGETLRQEKLRSLTETVEIITQVCKALEHAHGSGIIHRDLKLENIILTPSGVVKLMDFGLARTETDLHVTEEGAVIGTFQYIAPELLMGDPPSIQSDLYALGVMFYELACGQPPFKGSDFSALIAQHLQVEPARPVSHNPEIPAWMDDLILRMLMKHPNERPASAAEVRETCEHQNRKVDFTSMSPARHNLPARLTSFVGREKEIEQISAWIRSDQARLVTVTGAGGTGKTSLALEAAARLLEEFKDGVFLVELAPLTDPDLIPQVCVQTLALVQQNGVQPIETLVKYLAHKRFLFILDNCEHIIAACTQMVDVLLKRCPDLHILTTSREILSVPGETAFRVPSLSFPALHDRIAPEALGQYEAVRLFVERARQVAPDFTLSAENAEAVTQICRRLDGIPLAIELATARLRVLSAEQIAARLANTFRLLVGGSKAVLPRQQTLKALIDWSYNLLSAKEQWTLQRLSIFAGGWMLEAAEAVCADEQQVETDEVLDLLGQLVDKSLISAENGPDGMRYRMLETVRQYGHDRLLEAVGSQPVRNRHLAYFAAFARMAETHMRRKGMFEWLMRLEADLDNIRLALEWAVVERTDLGLQIGSDLMWFWHTRGRRVEGIDWLIRLLEAETQLQDPEYQFPARIHLRAKALMVMSFLEKESWALGRVTDSSRALASRAKEMFLGLPQPDRGMAAVCDYYRAGSQQDFEECLKAFRVLGDKFYQADCLLEISGRQTGNLDFDQAQTSSEEDLAIRRALGDEDGEGAAWWQLAGVALSLQDWERAEYALNTSMKLFHAVGNLEYFNVVKNRISWIEILKDNSQNAIGRLNEILNVGREMGSQIIIQDTLYWLIYASWNLKDFEQAEYWCEERERDPQVRGTYQSNYLRGRIALSKGQYDQAFAFLGRLKDFPRRPKFLSIQALGILAVARQQMRRAVILFGAAARQLARLDLPPIEKSEYELAYHTARTALGEETFQQAWAEGHAMDETQAVQFALQDGTD
jgi:predicted ATPase